MEHVAHDRHPAVGFEIFSQLHGDRAFLFAIDERRRRLHDDGPLPVRCTFPPSSWGEPDTTPCDACIDDHAARLARDYGRYLSTGVLPDAATSPRPNATTREEAPMLGT